MAESATAGRCSEPALPQGTKWQDWRERKGELFQAVRMEKNMMGLLLSLIIAVAAFNIIILGPDGDGKTGRSGDSANRG
jgi:ABC-type lipoprotein release transport system permease subunit